MRPEFEDELKTYGHIYMYRFRPKVAIKAYPVQLYPSKIIQSACMMHQIMNNLGKGFRFIRRLNSAKFQNFGIQPKVTLKGKTSKNDN